MKTLLFTIIIFSCLNTIMAIEYRFDQPQNWINGKIEKNSNDTLRLASREAWSAKLIPVDMTKKYLIAGSFKQAFPSSRRFYFGVMPFKQKRDITPDSVNILPGTETTLSQDARKGDTVLIFRQSRIPWKTGPDYLVAFNVDFSREYLDLPNHNTTSCGISKVDLKGELQFITLKSPLQKNMPKDVSVREHASGGYALWIASWEKAPEEFTEFRMIFDGEALYGSPSGKWRNSTDAVRLLIMQDGNERETPWGLLFRNITIKEIK